LRVLYLTSENTYRGGEIPRILKGFGESVIVCSKKISLLNIKKLRPDFIILDRYKFIIHEDICQIFKFKIINFHPSYLPYCRGSKPIFFSVFYKKPIGVSIHLVTKKLDAGPILTQKKIATNNNLSLRDIYGMTRKEFEVLLKKNWLKIKAQKIKVKTQPSNVNKIFKLKEFNYLFRKLKLNYDMTIKDINDCKKI
tara:strand:+ start:23911 stop:24498 length:588 start_codon:yes stop_codon:yes gene_type:complete